jgi:hypothetical protein
VRPAPRAPGMPRVASGNAASAAPGRTRSTCCTSCTSSALSGLKLHDRGGAEVTALRRRLDAPAPRPQRTWTTLIDDVDDAMPSSPARATLTAARPVALKTIHEDCRSVASSSGRPASWLMGSWLLRPSAVFPRHYGPVGLIFTVHDLLEICAYNL